MKIPHPWRALLLVLVVLSVATVIACAPPAAPTVAVNVNVVNTVTTSVVFGSAVPSSKAGCPAIGRIDVQHPEQLDKGAKAAISATPRTADGNKRDAECDLADGISWTLNPSELGTVGDPRAFDTELVAGSKAGKGLLGVSVGRSASASFPLEIR